MFLCYLLSLLRLCSCKMFVLVVAIYRFSVEVSNMLLKFSNI